MSSRDESFKVTNGAAATHGPFFVQGGLYLLSAEATWGGGSLTLQQKLPNGAAFSTHILTPASVTPAATLTANGVGLVYLAPGEVQLVFATGSALYAALTRIPLD